MAQIAAAAFIACAVHASFPFAFLRCRYTRNGGMRFLRIHRIQVSWCVCRSPLPR